MKRALLLLLGAGCAGSIPLPLTGAQLDRQFDGRSLVAYLGQPHASAGVCALRPGQLVPDGTSKDLIAAWDEGRIPPELGRECAARLLKTFGPGSGVRLLDRLADTITGDLRDRHLETTPVLQARLDALTATLLERPADRQPHAPALGALEQAARRARGPVASRYGAVLVEAIELDRGQLHGVTVDGAELDRLMGANDEARLRRCAQRLPDPALRTEARRRIVRLHIAASTDPAVRGDAVEIEARLMKAGTNPVALDQHPIERVVTLAGPPATAVSVRQDLPGRRIALLGATPVGALVPDLPLRGSLAVRAAGLDRPIGLCGRPEDLDPSPCLAVSDLAVASPLARPDEDGALHFVEELPLGDALGLARASHLELPLLAGGRPLKTLDWPLAFERPSDLVISDGAALAVRLEMTAAGRLIYQVGARGPDYVAVVESQDAGLFQVVSRGTAGASGSDGRDGSSGTAGAPGSSGSCPGSSGGDGGSGGPGEDGSDGSDGSPGGAGGDIDVAVLCDRDCDRLFDLARRTVHSEGGPGGGGGRGGRGGSGGWGGSGGMGASCTDSEGNYSSVNGGIDGMNGSDGSSGRDGSNGGSGPAGRIEVHAAH